MYLVTCLVKTLNSNHTLLKLLKNKTDLINITEKNFFK